MTIAIDPPWSVPGATLAADDPGAETFSATPLPDLLLKAAAIEPDAVAMVGGSGSLCYRDMLRLACNVAGAIAKAAAPGAAVACLLPRSPQGVAAIIGCLISGRLCMILDPGHPADRQALLLADAAPALLLLAEPLPFAHSAPVLTLDAALQPAAEARQRDVEWDPDAPLAVHFTSGSSGRPKGIVLSARATLYRAFVVSECWGLARSDVVSSLTIPVAGGGLSTMLGALCRGARVVLPDLGPAAAGAMLRLLEREAITGISLSPPMLRLFLGLERSKSAFRTLRMLRIGSASLLRSDFQAWRSWFPAECVIFHDYASTEALTLTHWVIDGDGKPPESAETFVAAGLLQPGREYALQDEDGRPSAPGPSGELSGELVVRGRYLAMGEWRGGQLVEGRMIPVPDRPGWRQFRTGDALRVRPDGMMQLLGRVDRQIKINGVRIEPEEIEALMRDEAGVTDAAVVACGGANGSLVLHGFIVAANADPAALVAALGHRMGRTLPTAFRPAHLTVLPRLPTMTSGKVDLAALAYHASQIQDEASGTSRS